MREARARPGVRCEAEPCGVRGLVFCTPKGRALTYAALNKVLKRAAAEANEAAGEVLIPPGVSTHWLRHTFITEAIENGMPVVAVNRYVSHEDIRVTMRVYYDCRPEYMRASVDMLDGVERYASSLAPLLPGEVFGHGTY